MSRLFFVYNPSKMAKTLRLNVLGPFHSQWSDGTVLDETGDERARHNLRQALSKIRRSYGPLISSNGETLALSLALRDALVAVV